MTELTHSNADLKAALDAMTTICVGVVVDGEVAVANRLPTLASLRADRTLRALRKAWAGPETDRRKLVTDLGDVKGDEHSIAPNTPAMAEFVKAWGVVMAEEQTVSIETLTLADIEAGWSRDMKTGAKGPLEISAAELGNLIALGIVQQPEEQGPRIVQDAEAAVGD